MAVRPYPSARAILTCAALAAVIGVPVVLSAMSPLLVWRGPVYTAACFAGIAALCIALVQSLLIGGYLPGLSPYRARRVHLWTGSALVAVMVLHVGGLWVTSPPDMIDALLFASPTLFSPWGVIGDVGAVRRRHDGWRCAAVWDGPLRMWRAVHKGLAAIIVAGGSAHGFLIEGIMEPVSKGVLCALTLVAAGTVIAGWRARPRL